ncbi:43372_t:CDS:2, partial [Gigaspora margarita]
TKDLDIEIIIELLMKYKDLFVKPKAEIIKTLTENDSIIMKRDKKVAKFLEIIYLQTVSIIRKTERTSEPRLNMGQIGQISKKIALTLSKVRTPDYGIAKIKQQISNILKIALSSVEEHFKVESKRIWVYTEATKPTIEPHYYCIYTNSTNESIEISQKQIYYKKFKLSRRDKQKITKGRKKEKVKYMDENKSNSFSTNQILRKILNRLDRLEEARIETGKEIPNASNRCHSCNKRNK